MAKFSTKSISNRDTFCNFSLAPKRKIYKTSMKHLKIHKFSFKNVIVLAIECKMYLKISEKNFADLVAFQNRPWAAPWRKQGWIPRRTISWWKASLSPQKESWAYFWTFSSLKTWWSRSSHFVENGYPSLRFPNMVKMNNHKHWTRVSRFTHVSTPYGFLVSGNSI